MLMIMTEGQERLRLAQQRFARASEAITERVRRATIADSGDDSPPAAPLDEHREDDLDRLEGELNEAIAELMLAARQVMGEGASGE
jgi:hypothetical protein